MMPIAASPLNGTPNSPLPNPPDEAEALAIVRGLLRRASTVPELLLSGDDLQLWPVAVFTELLRLGWLIEARQADGLTCDVCPDRCWITPQERRRRDGSRHLWYLCGRHEDTGVLSFNVDRLRRWRISADGIARWLCVELSLDADDLLDLGAGIIRVGYAGKGKGKREILLAFTAPAQLGSASPAESAAAPSTLWILTSRPGYLPPGDQRALILGEVLRWDGRLHLNLHARHRLTGAESTNTLRPVELPAGATWENVTIRVIDEETVEVQSSRHCERRTFVELGMADGRRSPPEPSLSWIFLRTLAREDGTLTWEDKAANDNARNHIRLLRDALRQAFGLEGDPFHRYERKLGWRTRFRLVDEREPEW